MCGIFGGIGNYNVGTLRALAVANMARGRDAVGFFTKNRLFKQVGNSITVLQREACNKWLSEVSATRKNWFLCGHTRMGTHGANTQRNAHPFRVQNYIGIHNGVINAPHEYTVDSEYFWDMIKSFEGNYQEAWEEIDGYWGLAWTDGDKLYLQSVDQELAVCDVGDAMYFSSDISHLASCVGVSQDDCEELTDGETWEFTFDRSSKNPIQVRELPALVRKNIDAYSMYANYNRSLTGSSNYRNNNFNSHRDSVSGPAPQTVVSKPDDDDLVIAGLIDDLKNEEVDYHEVFQAYVKEYE